MDRADPPPTILGVSFGARSDSLDLADQLMILMSLKVALKS
jgi:hypothetical protein